MKSNDPRVTTTRLYEISDVSQGSAWHTRVGARYDIRGTIVRHVGGIRFKIVKENSSRYPCMDGHNFSMNQLILRPLSQRDQQRIENA